MRRHPKTEQGVALVTTVIVVAVLAVVAVAFMQSTTVDRQASRSVANYTRAKLAAEAGAASAQILVADVIRRYPDSVTVWQNIGGGAPAGTNNEATVLYARAQSGDTNRGARPGQFGNDVTFLALPLLSRTNATNSTLVNTNPVPLGSVSSNLPHAVGSTNTVNLNATNASRPRPFIGLRSATNPGAPVTAAEWIYISRSGGPTNTNNPAIARYAFWVEDESFKVNVNVATNGPRGTDSLGLSPSEARLDGSWGSSSNSVLRGANFGEVVTARGGLPGGSFPTAATVAIPADLTSAAASDEMRFLTTTHSAGLDLSRGGFKRFNINAVTNGIGGPTDANNIRTSLNRVIAAITNSNSVPNFGQRFYRLATNTAGVNAAGAVTAAHAPIYLQKIAANLLDYVDNDDQPTVINNESGFPIRAGRPEYGIESLGGGTEGPNSAAAMGIENGPRLQEYAIHGRLRRMEPFGYSTNAAPPDPSAEYEVSIDHYFEFWNPGTRDITLTNAFLKIYDQPRFGSSITGALSAVGRPTSEIPVNNVVFPAGQVTVLTTAPQAEINTRLVGANASRVVTLPTPEADRVFSGVTRDVSTNTFGGFDRLFRVSLVARQSSVLDFESAVLLGNNAGILESFVGLPISISGDPPAPSPLHFVVSSADVQATLTDPAAGNAYFVRGGSLMGNSHITSVSTPSSTEGDPRALNEQLEFRLYTVGSVNAKEQTRFFMTISNNGLASVPGPDSSVGAPNANYVLPVNWVDHSSIQTGANNAPLVLRNGALQSIGELGHLTDPARVPGTNGPLTNVVYSRGGGRTFRVGQPEHPRWYDGNQTNASRTWASWRLADIFTTTSASNNVTSRDPLGNLTNSRGVVRGATNTNGAVVTIPGLINPNGALRDQGAALRAALQGMRFLPSPDGSVNTAGRPVNVNNIVSALMNRMTNVTGTGMPSGALNVFWERGELGELSVFNTASTLAGVNMQQAFDRGREEVVRRSIEMVTTRGSVFTVYAIGQTLQGTNVTGMARMRQIFQIEPQFATADAFDDNFNPSQAVRVTRRFAAPTNYTIRTILTTYD